MKRQEESIQKLGGAKSWEKTRDRFWELHRMYARQIFEAYGFPHHFTRHSLPNPFGCKEGGKRRLGTLQHKCSDGVHGSLVSPPTTDGQMNYAALSESGMLLLHVLSAANLCSNDTKNTCEDNNMLNWAIKRFQELDGDLNSRESTGEYTKQAVKMLHQIALGIRDLAEDIRPFGLNCYAQKNCKALQNKKKLGILRRKVLSGPLKKATDIQQKHMKQTPATPTLLFMPSYEIYGHLLLFLDFNEKAKEMFEKSLKERMGRTQSLVGLARSHAIIGNTEQADYFYGYILTQLHQADDGNLFVKEAKSWVESGGKLKNEELRKKWWWPYL